MLLVAQSPACLNCQHGTEDIKQAQYDLCAVLDEMSDTLQASGIEVEQVHAEAGHGQFEIATGPCSPVEVCIILHAWGACERACTESFHMLKLKTLDLHLHLARGQQLQPW